MIKLKENQNVDILRTGNEWYICVYDDKKLLTYKTCDLVLQNEEESQIKVKTLIEKYDTFKDYDIEKELKYIYSADDYSRYVSKIASLQNIEFEISALNKLAQTKRVPEDLKKAIGLIYKDVHLRLEAIEDVLKEVANNVPTNWPYLMFHESSWTAYPYMVRRHKLACGDTTYDAEDFGWTLEDAKRFDTNRRINNPSSEIDPHKDENIFLSLQKQVMAKNSDKEGDGDNKE